MEYRNLTPFPSASFQSYGQDGQTFHVAVLRATFEITPEFVLRALQDQAPLVLQDSMKQETDLAPFKPQCDVLIIGNAHAPGNKPTPRFDAGFTLRSKEKILLEKRVTVTGPRFWEKRIFPLGWKLTAPEPVASVPLQYEYAFGGPDYPSNPIGRGMRVGKSTRLPAPQIESVKDPVREFKQAYVPAGFGVTGKNWQPRLKKAGTYGAEWQKARHPYLPEDYDFSYWNGAPADQQTPWLEGNEHVELLNLSADGRLTFDLPGHMMYALVRYEAGHMIPTAMNLDTLIIDPDNRLVSCVWRLRIAAEPAIRVMEARLVSPEDAAVQENLRGLMQVAHE